MCSCQPDPLGHNTPGGQLEVSDINDKMARAYALVTEGEFTNAVAAASQLVDEHGAHDSVLFNCAGIFTDAGDRTRTRAWMERGHDLFVALYEREAPFGEQLLYNLGNSKSTLLKGARSPGDRTMRDLSAEEEALSLYFEAGQRFREATPEVVINCASLMRVSGRVYEAIDFLDGVLRTHPDHSYAHHAMGNALWEAWVACLGRDGCAESLVVPAVWHFARAEACSSEPLLRKAAEGDSQRLQRLIAERTTIDLEQCLEDIDLKVPASRRRTGPPFGLSTLTRSPYRDEDEPWLVEDIEPDLRSAFEDAAGTYAVGRHLLLTDIDVVMPRWGASTPDQRAHQLSASLRQSWSVLEKVGAIINRKLEIGLGERTTTFRNVFLPPPRVRKALKLEDGVIRPPALEGDNPGLLALNGIATALQPPSKGEPGNTYHPLKSLRNVTEHRIPTHPVEEYNAFFTLGIARAALLHAVDAVQWASDSA